MPSIRFVPAGSERTWAVKTRTAQWRRARTRLYGLRPKRLRISLASSCVIAKRFRGSPNGERPLFRAYRFRSAASFVPLYLAFQTLFPESDARTRRTPKASQNRAMRYALRAQVRLVLGAVAAVYDRRRSMVIAETDLSDAPGRLLSAVRVRRAQSHHRPVEIPFS